MYKESVIPVKAESFSVVAGKSSIGQCVRSVLRRALVEKRLTIGLMPALQYLSNNCNGALFCFTTEATPGDSATHMQEVLLQAFCAENDIYIVKVDSVEKMRRAVGGAGGGNHHSDHGCVLVHSPYADPFADSERSEVLSDAERELVTHCRLAWGSTAAVVKLPEK